MEAFSNPSGSNQLESSEYFIRRAVRGMCEEDGRQELCLNEDDMELARILMMLANGVEKKKDAQVDGFVNAPRCYVALLTEPMATKIGGCHQCNLCGKEFKSYQALGGHKASHRKSVGSGEVAAAVLVERFKSDSRVHECSICHKQFPSGQALGGHKRRHYEGHLEKQNNQIVQSDKPMLSAANSNSDITTTTNSDTVSHQGFDLNIPASPDFCSTMVAEEVQSPHPASNPYEHSHIGI